MDNTVESGVNSIPLATCRLPDVDLNDVSAFLQKHYGLEGGLTALNGERDLNFLVTPKNSNSRFVFKVCNAQESAALLELQAEVMRRIRNGSGFESIETLPTLTGQLLPTYIGSNDDRHLCRLTTYMEGRLFSAINPHTDSLLSSLGEAVAGFAQVVSDLDRTALDRPLLWRMEEADSVVEAFLPLIQCDERSALLRQVQSIFAEQVLCAANQLPSGIIHNDANDNNIVVDGSLKLASRVKGLIDFGDMVYGWKVADLAVACAYAMLNKPDPLDIAGAIVAGYQEVRKLEEIELACLYPMIMMRLALSVSISARQKMIEPDNGYLTISEQPAWALLDSLVQIHPRYANYYFRHRSGLEVIPTHHAVLSWIKSQDSFDSICNLPASADELLLLDASVSSASFGESGDDYDVEKECRNLARMMEDAEVNTAIGRYDEYRLIYQSDDFVDATGHQRTLHLGIDIFQSAGSPIFSPIAGVVQAVANNDTPFDYGGTVILRHEVFGKSGEALSFYTLYGHLSPDSIASLQPEKLIAAGEQIATMGEPDENGSWPPHVHFEIVLDLLGEEGTFVGVGSHAHRDVWLALCPDPNTILRLPTAFLEQPLSDAQRDPAILRKRRDSVIPASLSVSYREPLSIARGVGQYLFDYTGRRYLDAVNNVPHVGHCHPAVVAAERKASTVLNTNTRYLYRGLGEYAERLLEKCPSPLSRVFMVNSGSEANDLALRMARCHTGRKQIMTLEHGYHGNLGALIDISGYKHNGPGGEGAPDWVHKVPLPDSLRSENPGEGELAVAVRLLQEGLLSDDVAAFISESISGCGGQVMLPEGFLASLYDLVRSKGGVCIADEVQTGFGRVGSHFWAFETQHVVPDILTIGKPAGNGFPLGAVITTPEIAQSFNNGMEYFNTFGGNPVACAVGTAVLTVIEDERLEQHAHAVGKVLKTALAKCINQYPLIGEVRGAGLFLGVELVTSPGSLTPAPGQAGYIVERMKDNGVLISTDGPHHNVLKIKPPLAFDERNAVQLVETLERVLQEDGAQPA